ncbi:MAG: AAA family ATPase [Caulobacter sp.]|nr:AAA family ATPase [Caulobacter sp.]
MGRKAAKNGKGSAQRLVITVVAIDIVDSMRHIADCDPDEAETFFDSWLEHFHDVVDRHGGCVIDEAGDGAIAAFGWPRSLEDHADRACIAGWALQSTRDDSLGPSGEPVRLRVGVHSGLAALRRSASGGRRKLRTVGATVHIAAKLQQSAPPGGIRLSEEVARLCRSRLSLTPAEPTEILQQIGVAPFSLDARPENTLAGDITQRYRQPMAGRAAELALIREALPGDGCGSAIALIGEPGIGKSRLAAAAMTDAVARDLKRLVFFGDAQKRSTPFAAVRALLGDLLGEAAETRESLGAALAGLSLDVDERVALESLLAAPDGGREKARGRDPTTKLTQMQLTRAFVRGFHALAFDRPAVLLVEDLHLVDPESRQFLKQLAAEEAPHPFCLILTGRPEALQSARDIARTVLRLEALPAADMRDLARQLWPDGEPPAPVLDQMLVRADGVPFVLEELVRSVEGVDPPAFQVLPHGVESVIHARLQQLSPGARATAQALSLLGEDVDVGFVASVLGIGPEAVMRRLSELERFAFVHPVSRQSTHMRHQIIAEACADTIPRERRRELHATAARVIIARHAGLAGRHEQLAFHAEGAGDDAAALDHLWQAGLEARRNSAAASLNLIFDRAVTVMARLGEAADGRYVDFLLMAFAAMVQLGEFEKVNRHLPPVMALVRRAGRPELTSGALSQLGMLCWFEGRYAEGLAATEEGLAIARELNAPALMFSNLIMQTNILHDMGHVRRAIAEEQELCDLLTGDLETARLGASGIPRATALAFMSWYLVDIGHYDEALDYARQAFEVATREQDTYAELLARNTLGRTLLLLQRDEEAADCLMVGREISERDGYDAIQPNLIGRAAHALARIGRSTEAIDMIEECLDRGLHRRTGVMEVFNLTAGHAEALYRGGDRERGLQRLDEALAIARRVDNPCLLLDGLGLRARLLAETAPDDPRLATDLDERRKVAARYDLALWPEALSARG